MLHKNNKLRFGAAIVAGIMSAGCLLADISVAMAAPPPPPPHRDDRRKPPPPKHNVKPTPPPRHDVKPMPPRPPRPDVKPMPPRPPRPDVRPHPPGPKPHPVPPPPPGPKPHPKPPPPPPPPPKEHKDTNGSFWTGLIVGGIAGAVIANSTGSSHDSSNPNSEISNYNDAVIYDESGVKAYENGNYDKAIEQFDKAIYADRSYLNPYLHRSKAYMAKGMYNAALDDAEECINYGNDRYAEAYAIRAQVRIYKGESLYDALADYDRAVRIEPNNRRWYYERSKVYRDLGRQEEARQDFNRAWEMSSANERSEMYADYYGN